jgi:HSP20 family protein
MAQTEKQSKSKEKSEGKIATASRDKESQKGIENREPQTGLTRRESYLPRASQSPFTFMRRFSEEMDRLFEDFGFSSGRIASSWGRGFGRLGELEKSLWAPPVEVFERGDQLIVRADLPGLTKDDIDVDITDDAIVIRGERRQQKEENEEGYYRSERSYGSFYREIPLPAGINTEEANANFRNGVLEITLPAPERQSRRRRIEIGEGTETKEQPKSRAKAAGR